ncbi:hypothetical protein BU17DRAFT_61525 [Hysterangium stoloniferum]|nr:hypothetical protein BU17DRAFT_61525 [Hysterangium stoloniferum]
MPDKLKRDRMRILCHFYPSWPLKPPSLGNYIDTEYWTATVKNFQGYRINLGIPTWSGGGRRLVRFIGALCVLEKFQIVRFIVHAYAGRGRHTGKGGEGPPAYSGGVSLRKYLNLVEDLVVS